MQSVESGAETRMQHPDPRLYLAAERTLLAWIRTGLALIAFGFVLARVGIEPGTIGVAMNNSQQGPVASTMMGALLVLMGIALLVVSLIRHRGYVRAMEDQRFHEVFDFRMPLVLVVSLCLAGGWLLYLLLATQAP